jgi:hypothetical protein
MIRNLGAGNGAGGFDYLRCGLVVDKLIDKDRLARLKSHKKACTEQRALSL